MEDPTDLYSDTPRLVHPSSNFMQTKDTKVEEPTTRLIRLSPEDIRRLLQVSTSETDTNDFLRNYYRCKCITGVERFPKLELSNDRLMDGSDAEYQGVLEMLREIASVYNPKTL